MKLLIDCVANKLDLLLINNKNQIINFLNLKLNNNLNEIFVDKIIIFLNKNNIKKESINELFIINGPGSFTSLKIISIFANTWKMIFNIKIYQIDFGKWNSIYNNEILWWNDKQKNIFYYINDGKNNKTKKTNCEKFENVIRNNKDLKIRELKNNDVAIQWKKNKDNFNIVNKFVPYYIDMQSKI